MAGRKRGGGKYPEAIPKTMVGDEIIAAVEELMAKYGIGKSDAIRAILDNGLVYMSIYGDGIPEKSRDK